MLIRPLFGNLNKNIATRKIDTQYKLQWIRKNWNRSSSNTSTPTVVPPSIFQGNTTKPPPYNSQSHQQIPIQNEKLSIFKLFTNRSTRWATIKLVTLLTILQVLMLYAVSNAVLDELEDTESKLLSLWDFYERRDISQAVMAIHIGQLKQQLIDADVKPVSAMQALSVAQHLISFTRDEETGNLLIFVDPNSKIYKLVPFSTEYDLDKSPRLSNAVRSTWEEYKKNNSD